MALQAPYIPEKSDRDAAFFRQWAENHSMTADETTRFLEIYDASMASGISHPDSFTKAYTEYRSNSTETESTIQEQPKEETQQDQSNPSEQKNDNNSSQEDKKPNKANSSQEKQPDPIPEEPQSSSSSQKENVKGKRYSRIIQNAKERTIQAPSPQRAYTPTFACLSKKEREKGDAQLQENIKALYDNSTLLDVLVDHKDTIKELRKRGYGDDTICKLFMNSYKFEKVTPADLECALYTPKRKKTA